MAILALLSIDLEHDMAGTEPTEPYVLLIEEEIVRRDLLIRIIANSGFNVRSFRTVGEAIRTCANDASVLCVVIDTEYESVVICETIRKQWRAPILLVCRESPPELRRGDLLRTKADEIILRPFEERELVGSVYSLIFRDVVLSHPGRHLVRRSKSGRVSVDLIEAIVAVDNRVMELSLIEYRILLLLVLSNGKSVSTDVIGQVIWDRRQPLPERDLVRVRMYISRIRKKIGTNSEDQEVIVTVPGQGYSIR